MHACDVPHVVADPVLVGCQKEVLPGELSVAVHLPVESEVEVRVEAPLIDLALRRIAGLGGREGGKLVFRESRRDDIGDPPFMRRGAAMAVPR